MRTVPTIAFHASFAAPVAGRAAGRIMGILSVLARPRRRLLDMRDLPDHLKRDIGALDGNDPRGPRP